MATGGRNGYVPLFFAALIAVEIVASGFDARANGVARAEWLPEVTFGVLLGALVPCIVVADWIGADPVESDEFGLVHWTALLGFGSWIVAGGGYVLVGYDSTYAWMMAVLGVGGCLLLVRVKYELSVRGRPDGDDSRAAD